MNVKLESYCNRSDKDQRKALGEVTLQLAEIQSSLRTIATRPMGEFMSDGVEYEDSADVLLAQVLFTSS